MGGKAQSLSKSTRQTAMVLGNQIAQGRRARRMTLAELSQRVGVSEPTMRNVENGSPSVAIGTFFEAARIVGLPLFTADSRELTSLLHRSEEKLSLMPERVRSREVKDDF